MFGTEAAAGSQFSFLFGRTARHPAFFLLFIMAKTWDGGLELRRATWAHSGSLDRGFWGQSLGIGSQGW